MAPGLLRSLRLLDLLPRLLLLPRDPLPAHLAERPPPDPSVPRCQTEEDGQSRDEAQLDPVDDEEELERGERAEEGEDQRGGREVQRGEDVAELGKRERVSALVSA